MNTQVLLASLNGQDKNLEQLIATLQKQKAAIIKNDYAALDKEILNEQNILSRMEKEETTRHKTVKEISNQLAIEIEKLSIDELLKNGKTKLGGDYKKIETVRMSIKDKLETVLNLNSQLKSVIDFSRNMIKETLLMVAGENKHAIVNKRV